MLLDKVLAGDAFERAGAHAVEIFSVEVDDNFLFRITSSTCKVKSIEELTLCGNSCGSRDETGNFPHLAILVQTQ